MFNSQKNISKKLILVSMNRKGGGSLCAYEMAKSIRKFDETLPVIISSYDENKKKWLENIGPPIEFIPTYNNHMSYIIDLFFNINKKKWTKILKQSNRNIVIEPMSSLWTLPMMNKTKTKMWIPFIHDIIPHESNFKKIIKRNIDKIIDLEPVIGVLSEYCRNLLINKYQYGSNKIIKINHGIFMFHDSSYKIKSDDIILNNKKLLYFGRIEPYKGLDILLNAFNEISKTDPEIELTIAGYGNLGNINEKIFFNKQVRIINKYLNEIEIDELFRTHCVCVLPYKHATQSGVMALCLGYGMPVIATDVGGLPEQIRHGETGLLIPPNNVSNLSNTILQLLNNKKLLFRMKENVFEFAKSDFQWDDIVGDMLCQLHNRLQQLKMKEN